MMKLINVFLVILSALIFSSNVAYSSRIWSWYPFGSITSMYEVDEINNNDLYSSIGMNLYVSPNISQYTNNFTFKFYPFEGTWHQPVKNFNVTICKGYSSGYGYFYVTIICDESPLQIFVNKTSMPNTPDEYEITFPIQNSSNYENYMVSVSYKLPNFVIKQGKNYIAWFGTVCQPGIPQCPPEGSIFRVLVLPTEDSVIERIPDGARVDRPYNKWVILTSSYDYKQVWYSKSSETEILTPFFWAFMGALIGVVIGIPVELVVRSFIQKKVQNREETRHHST